MEQPNRMCRFQKFGFCKFGSKCYFRHSEEICHNVDCGIKTCFKRHPSPCKFFFLTQKCKFKENCSYSHRFQQEKESSNKVLEAKETEIEELKNEIDMLKLQNENLKKENDILIRKVEDIEKSFAKQLEYIDFVLKEKEDMKKVNEVLIKDVKIINDKMKHVPTLINLENENLPLEVDEKATNENSENTIDNFDLFFAQSFPCDLCKHTSNSIKGLNIHIGRKHKNSNIETPHGKELSFGQLNTKPMVSHMPIVAGLMD